MNEQEFAELAAGYALGALSPDDLAAFETARAQHPEWESILATDAATAVALAETVAPVTPPPAIRDALLARVAMTPQERPVAAPQADGARAAAPDTVTVQAITRRNWTRGMLGLAASLILLVALGMGAVMLGQFLNRPASAIALEQIENAPDAQSASDDIEGGGSATVHWSESVGKVVLVSNGLPSIDDDETFELWYVRDGEPVSAGVFDTASAPTGTKVLLDGAIEPGDIIAVTVEQAGGSPSGQPTTEPIVAIPTA